MNMLKNSFVALLFLSALTLVIFGLAWLLIWNAFIGIFATLVLISGLIGSVLTEDLK